MADSEKGVDRALPGEEPWEFDWPDDAKELRQAEREAARKAAEITPAPRFLTAYVLGVWTVLAFVLVITAVAQVVGDIFIPLVFPIAFIGLFAALPLGYLLDLLTRNLNPGVAGLVFLLVGGFVGYFWSYMIVTWLYEHDFGSFDAASSSDRMAVAILFLTATATAFFVAWSQADNFKRYRKAVVISTITLAGLFIPSAILFARALPEYT